MWPNTDQNTDNQKRCRMEPYFDSTYQCPDLELRRKLMLQRIATINNTLKDTIDSTIAIRSTKIELGKNKHKSNPYKKPAIDLYNPDAMIEQYKMLEKNLMLVLELHKELTVWLSGRRLMYPLMQFKEKLFYYPGEIPDKILADYYDSEIGYLWYGDNSCAYIVRQLDGRKTLDKYGIVVELFHKSDNLTDNYLIYVSK